MRDQWPNWEKLLARSFASRRGGLIRLDLGRDTFDSVDFVWLEEYDNFLKVFCMIRYYTLFSLFSKICFRDINS